MRNLRTCFLSALVLLLTLASCYRNEIDFGNDPDNNYTRLVYVDTVKVQLSTLLRDSFATSGVSSMLLGKYKDPYLGIVSAKPFFQLRSPQASVDIPSTAVFDSLMFIFKINRYYYGDTTRQQTIYVNELDKTIAYTYNDKLYNTSNVPVKPLPLGSRTLQLRPNGPDSIVIKLDHAKGLELFTKLRQKSTDVTDQDEFLRYFKGISLSVGNNDTTAVWGVKGDNSIMMRVMYHHSIPVYENKTIDFVMENTTYAFNQVLADRSGTSLPSTVSGTTVIPSSQTGNVSFTQPGLGILLKMTFPSLRNLNKNDDIVKLIKAELIVRPAYRSYDRAKYKLPSPAYLSATNGSNIVGQTLTDSSGSEQYIYPSIDNLFNENTHYRFDVTSYVNYILSTAGTEDYGFFMLENWSASSMQVNRAVISDSRMHEYETKLVLSLLIINK